MRPDLSQDDIRSLISQINQHDQKLSVVPDANLTALTMLKLMKCVEEGMMNARYCTNDLEFLKLFNEYTELAASLVARVYPSDADIKGANERLVIAPLFPA